MDYIYDMIDNSVSLWVQFHIISLFYQLFISDNIDWCNFNNSFYSTLLFFLCVYDYICSIDNVTTITVFLLLIF